MHVMLCSKIGRVREKGLILMATQEERLTLLEQNIPDINHNETLLLGMAMKQGEQIQEIRLNLASLSEHIDIFERSVNSRFDRIETSLVQVIARLPEQP